MAHIRTYHEVLELTPTKAEERLIECARAGNVCTFNDGQLPEADQTSDCEIRAEILRYLILGGCEGCVVDTIGIELSGARITGDLNLNFVGSTALLALRGCRFQRPIQLYHSYFSTLDLSGSHFTSFDGGGMTVSNNVMLREVISLDNISISAANIGGQLNLIGAQLEAVGEFALSVSGAEIKGSIFFHPTRPNEQKEVETNFNAKGGIDLTGSNIGGLYAEDISVQANGNGEALRAPNMTVNGPARFDGSTLTGQMNLTGAKITGDLSCKGATFDTPKGDAFIARRMQVVQSFIWRKDATATGKVILDGAHVAELDDNPRSWPDQDKLSLDGLTYNRITEYTAYDDARRKWLRDGSLVGAQFFPQPYTQYAKFLRDTGHDAQARQVLLTRERMVRRYQRPEFNPLHRAWRYFWDGLQLVVVGHGHAPFWSIGWLALLMVLATIPAHLAWEEGSFAPNSGPVIVSEGWQKLHASEDNPAKVWSGDIAMTGWSPPDTGTSEWDQTQFNEAWKPVAPGRDWETFNRYAYAADIVIPLINFGQTDAWAPSTTRKFWGWHLWWLRWVFTVFGWIVTALGAAAITGIIRRE